ncbi:MAG: anaerobic ribonucleoside-triphosphate reductase activating protein [Pseudomonadota bacterium]|nr:anaerobic ribonucleoside-triphosphate reductase activating protein [Pseudomonadota bacterium]
MPSLRIGGFTPFTTTDYPGLLAAVVFCQGCPWRCTYCHNPHLLPVEGPESHVWPDLLRFLESRRGLLDAVVFSGGEPTLQGALADAMRAVKALGFRIGLHSAGMYPDRLARVLPLVDWIGLDIKAPRAAYPRITGVPAAGAAVFDSLRLILGAGVDYELRCTWHPDLLSAADLASLGDELQALGADRLVLQECRPTGRASAIPPGWHDDDGVTKLAGRFRHFTLRPG